MHICTPNTHTSDSSSSWSAGLLSTSCLIFFLTNEKRVSKNHVSWLRSSVSALLGFCSERGWVQFLSVLGDPPVSPSGSQQSQTARVQFRETRNKKSSPLPPLKPQILPPCPSSLSPPLSLISVHEAPIQQGAAGSRWAGRRGATWESVACGGSDCDACGGPWAMTGAARPAGGWVARTPRRSRTPPWRSESVESTPWTPGRAHCQSHTRTPAVWRTW